MAALEPPFDLSLLELVSTWEAGSNLDAELELCHAQTELRSEATVLQNPLAPAALEASARACGRGAFVDAMRACGLLDEILASPSHAEEPIGLTLLAPPDVALTTLPEDVRCDHGAMRALLRAHVCIGVHTTGALRSGDELAGSASVALRNDVTGGGSGERALLHTLGGQAHCVALSGRCVRVANARVERADVGFSSGVLHLLDGLLWALVPLGEGVRAEQVRGKKVLPSPEVMLLGAPEHAKLEVHALLVHRATGQLMADGLRGHVRAVGPRGAAVRFAELVIEQKPSSLVRKKGGSVEEQRVRVLGWMRTAPAPAHAHAHAHADAGADAKVHAHAKRTHKRARTRAHAHARCAWALYAAGVQHRLPARLLTLLPRGGRAPERRAARRYVHSA